jgi:hypothetical protein
VPAFADRLAHFPGLLAVKPEQAVDDGRLADAGRADKGNGLAGTDVGPDRVEPGTGLRADLKDFDHQFDRPELHHCGRRVGADVGFVQDDDRGGAAAEHGRDVAFDAARVEIPVEPGDEEDSVDVRREDLFCGPSARDLTRYSRATGQQRVDGSTVFAVRPDCHPVADCREFAALLGLVPETARQLGGQLGLAVVNEVEQLFLAGDAAGPETLAAVLGQPAREVVAPAEG